MLSSPPDLRAKTLAAISTSYSRGVPWTVVSGHEHLAAIMKKSGKPIYIFRGKLTRDIFKVLVDEARSAGADLSKGMSVYCDLATYMGDSIDWTRLSDVVTYG